MKPCLICIFLLVFYPSAFGQIPAPSIAPTKEARTSLEKTRRLGSSLEKYKNETKGSQRNSKDGEPYRDEIIRIDTHLVVNDVLVTDQNGQAVKGLTKDDFVVDEDGDLQTLEMFASDETASVPRSVVLVLELNHIGLPFLNKNIQAAKLLVEKLDPGDKMAIVTADLSLMVDLTRDKTLLKNTLDSLNAKAEEYKRNWAAERRFSMIGYGMDEFEALLAVLNEMFAPEDKRPIIIFQAGGNSILRIKTGDDSLWRFYTSHTGGQAWSRRYLKFSDITEAVERSRVTIFSIIPGIRVVGLPKKQQLERARISIENMANQLEERDLIVRDDSRRASLTRTFQDAELKRLLASQTAVATLAELSGGFTSYLEKPEDSENIYSSIIKTIKNRYVLGYYPTKQEYSGKRRTIRITVRDHHDYVVTGRKSYIY